MSVITKKPVGGQRLFNVPNQLTALRLLLSIVLFGLIEFQYFFASVLVFVVAAVYERTARKYGQERSPRYVHLEAGHAAQNLLLQAVALDLGAVPVGAFDDAGVRTALSLPADHQPLYLIPAGHSR